MAHRQVMLRGPGWGCGGQLGGGVEGGGCVKGRKDDPAQGSARGSTATAGPLPLSTPDRPTDQSARICPPQHFFLLLLLPK